MRAGTYTYTAVLHPITPPEDRSHAALDAMASNTDIPPLAYVSLARSDWRKTLS